MISLFLIVVVTGKVLDARNGTPVQAYVKVNYRPTRRDIVSTVTRPDGRFRLSFIPTEEIMLMIYTDDKSVYPYYKLIPIDKDKDNHVVVRSVAMAPGGHPFETAEFSLKP